MGALASEFQRHGYQFEQLFRDGDIAVYFKTRGRHGVYEVIRVRHHDAYELAGKQFPAGESYPTSEMWGTHGWTYTVYSVALAKAYELAKAAKGGASK